MKQCSKCTLLKPADQFNKKGKHLHSLCKECNKLYQAEWYLKNSDKVKSKSRLSNKISKVRNQKYVRGIKASKGCFFCPEKEPVALDFHHTSNDKEHNIARLANSSNAIEFIEKEIAKCIVVCSNCHRKLHAGLLQVPTQGVEP
jgi:hypothetical protein